MRPTHGSGHHRDHIQGILRLCACSRSLGWTGTFSTQGGFLSPAPNGRGGTADLWAGARWSHQLASAQALQEALAAHLTSWSHSKGESIEEHTGLPR